MIAAYLTSPLLPVLLVVLAVIVLAHRRRRPR